MNNQNFTSRLLELCGIDGVSGFEGRVRKYIKKAAKPYADECITDTLGNLLVFKRGESSGKTLMLAAHMDEVGLMVRGATDDGFLRFGTVGGIDRRILLGKSLRCGKNKLPGVIGIKPPHLSRGKAAEDIPQIEALYIDIGAASREAALKKVPLGDVCAFDCTPEIFGKDAQYIKAKALDDRIGCAVLLELLADKPRYDTWFAFTVQEEVGLRGAFTAAYKIKPDIALIVEGTTAADTPNLEGSERVCSPSKGVVLSYMDSGTIYARKLFERLRAICESENIPWQLKRKITGGTDASAIQRSGAGVLVSGIAAAVRYIHSPVSVASISDCENIIKLTRRFLLEC